MLIHVSYIVVVNHSPHDVRVLSVNCFVFPLLGVMYFHSK